MPSRITWNWNTFHLIQLQHDIDAMMRAIRSGKAAEAKDNAQWAVKSGRCYLENLERLAKQKRGK